MHFAALAWPRGTPLQTRAALCRTAKNCYYADRPPLVPPTRRRRLLLPTLYASRRDALAQQGPPPPQHYRQRVRAAAARRNEETMPPVQAPGGNFITHFIASWMENSDATEKRMIDHTLRLHAGCLRMRQSWTEAQHTPAGWKPQRKEARPYFLALTSHSQAVQKTNSLDSLIAFHEGQAPDAK